MNREIEIEREQEMRELAAALGFPEMDPRLLNLALCHSSYANEVDGCENYGNERLEFLGDAVVGFAVTEALYEDNPDEREGYLSKIKSVVVSKRILARRADELHLGDHLLLGKGEEQTGGRTRFSILGNVFESVVGAIHLACGIDASKRFVLDQLHDEIDKALRGDSINDYKSMLQEEVQKKHGVLPIYRVVSAEGPDHDKMFVVEVFIRDRRIGRGEGKSKKRAERAAASDALKTLHVGLEVA